LVVTLPREVAQDEAFRLRIRAVCRPTANTLDGLYYDTTPPGAPPQMISQCQQWGFQRILPIIDDCTAKCTWRTRLEADARYTHLVSNGDICRETNPDGRPVPLPGDASRQAITYVNTIPMPSYLFLVAVGTWDMLADSVTLPNGRVVRLEYLVPPGKIEGARIPMEILKDSVLWHARTLDYEYRRDCYRTICMEKSNFGGMENVGNTTIITEAALVDKWTSDRRLIYAHGVILHEFEHNHCGSDVTMESPFDMWLNEAYTVDIERQYLNSVFDPVLMRLHDVDAMRAPLSGPLAVEDGGHMGNIVREGFNHPDEVVDGVTYVKAPEVLSMLRRILGQDTYLKATRLYFRRHLGGNANTDQFLACFSEASGRDLSQFFHEWLFTIGYPQVSARHRYDPATRRLAVTLTQMRTGGGRPFHLPMALAAVDAEGRDLPAASGTMELTQPEQTFAFEGVPPFAFLSYNRGVSFYGTFRDSAATPETLALQVRHDPDLLNRVEAMRQLTDVERIRLIKDPDATPSPTWQALFASLLADASLPPAVTAYLLAIERQSVDRRYLPMPVERLRAWRSLRLAAVTACGEAALMAAFERVDTTTRRPAREGVEARQLKGVLADLLCALGTPAAWARVERHFNEAWNITDRLSAAGALDASEAPCRRHVMEALSTLCRPHVAAYSAYLAMVARSPHDDVYERVAAEEGREPFRIDHPGHSRSLLTPFAGNDAQLWTSKGMAWMQATILRLARVNENTTLRLLSAFQLVRDLPAAQRQPTVALLQAVRDQLTAAECPSVVGRATAYLAGVEAAT
jgi:aminopeptidase N